MSEIVVSSSSNSDNREIDEYHDSTSDNSSSNSNSSRSNGSNSSGGNTTDEQYMSRVPGAPLEVLQEELRTRVVSESMLLPLPTLLRPPPQMK